MQERLQKILSRAGVASRRKAEALVAEGRISVNGVVVTEAGTKADLEGDDVRVDGVRVRGPREQVYLALNKPKGVVSTRRDPARRPTVMDCVPHVPGLFPIGRLDLTTEGLILLTNDGAFAELVAHPRYEVARVYLAKVHGVPSPETLERLRRGVRVDAERLSVDRVRVLKADNNAWLEVALHEGKHHEVRRLMQAVGHPVAKLKRLAIGPVTVRGLQPGEFRALTADEIEGLREARQPPDLALPKAVQPRRHGPRRPPAALKPAAPAQGRKSRSEGDERRRGPRAAPPPEHGRVGRAAAFRRRADERREAAAARPRRGVAARRTAGAASARPAPARRSGVGRRGARSR